MLSVKHSTSWPHMSICAFETRMWSQWSTYITPHCRLTALSHFRLPLTTSSQNTFFASVPLSASMRLISPHPLSLNAFWATILRSELATNFSGSVQMAAPSSIIFTSIQWVFTLFLSGTTHRLYPCIFIATLHTILLLEIGYQDTFLPFVKDGGLMVSHSDLLHVLQLQVQTHIQHNITFFLCFPYSFLWNTTDPLPMPSLCQSLCTIMIITVINAATKWGVFFFLLV